MRAFAFYLFYLTESCSNSDRISALEEENKKFGTLLDQLENRIGVLESENESLNDLVSCGEGEGKVLKFKRVARGPNFGLRRLLCANPTVSD